MTMEKRKETIYFITGNNSKFKEINTLFQKEDLNYELKQNKIKTTEIQASGIKEVALFNIALGTWMMGFAEGLVNNYDSDHFNHINTQLEAARDTYHNYLYSVTTPQFVPGVDFQAEDLNYINCNGLLM